MPRIITENGGESRDVSYFEATTGFFEAIIGFYAENLVRTT